MHVWSNQQLNDFTVGVSAKSCINKAEIEVPPGDFSSGQGLMSGFCPLCFP